MRKRVSFEEASACELKAFIILGNGEIKGEDFQKKKSQTVHHRDEYTEQKCLREQHLYSDSDTCKVRSTLPLSSNDKSYCGHDIPHIP